MNKLTPEQRDEFTEWMRWEIFDGDNYLPAKVLKGLDRITADDERKSFSWDNTYNLLRAEFPELDQVYTAYICDTILEGLEPDKEIALRKFREEVMKKQSNSFAYVHLREWGKANDKSLGYRGSALSMFLYDVADWLQQEDEDE